MSLFVLTTARPALVLSLALLANILLGVQHVAAADISVAENAIISQQDQTPKGCNMYLRGEIVSGDAQRLRRAYEAVEPARQYSPVFLCLNSTGGSFVEALQILQWLIDADTGIATVINAGEQCLSACAIVFMGGSEYGHLNRYPRRWLHAKAKLGFHTPYIDADALPQRTYTAQELMNGFAAAMTSSRELATQFARLRTQVDEGAIPKPWVRTSLFIEMLLKGPNELLYVDTVDKIGRWEIDLFGATAPRSVTLEQARVACKNAVAWMSDRFASELHSSEVRAVYAMDIIKKNRSVDGQRVTTAEFWVNGRQVSSCRFSHKYWSEYSNAEASANVETEAVSGANRAWMIYPPTTRLSALARN